jgi:A/G-specific adenine glycosylase
LALSNFVSPKLSFAKRLLTWHARYGRHELPWQTPRTPYRVWLSEIMLQQTGVTTVIPYFQRFVTTLPTISALAAAPIDQVMQLWAGLGYYSRARNLHRAARICVEQFAGALPSNAKELMTLPGIGESTAGAILSQAFGQRAVILDGNVKRVIARHALIAGDPKTRVVLQSLWQAADLRTPPNDNANYTQAIMDLGATICSLRSPDCGRCPVSSDCAALAQNRTQEFPQVSKRAKIPTRERFWLVARSSTHQVLLEKRVASGIWGGLWSFPEFQQRAELLAHCAAEFPSETNNFVDQAIVKHVFTHFALRATPVVFKLSKRPKTAVRDHSALRWFGADEISSVGLPAPVRKWLLANQN